MIIINKANIKTQLNISASTYDSQINLLIPQLLNQFCEECKTDFIMEGYNGKIYDACNLVFTSTTITYDTDVCDINFQVGDFIRIYGTDYNNGLYQINSVSSGVITIETSKSMRTEEVSAYIALINFPDEFLQLCSKYVDQNIVNDSNVASEQIDDTQISYNTKEPGIKSFIQQNSSLFNNYRKAFKEHLFKGSEY